MSDQILPRYDVVTDGLVLELSNPDQVHNEMDGDIALQEDRLLRSGPEDPYWDRYGILIRAFERPFDIVDIKSRCHFNAVYLPASERTAGVTIKSALLLPTWIASHQEELQADRYLTLALEHPDTDFLMLDPLGQGRSSNLRPDLAWNMSKTGSYRDNCVIMAGALNNFGFCPDIILGESNGGRLAFAVAGAMQQPPKEVITLVVPGSTGHSPFEFLDRLFIKEGHHDTEYWLASHDPFASAIAESHHQANRLRLLGRGASRLILPPDRFIQKILAEGFANSRGLRNPQDRLTKSGLFRDISFALHRHPDLRAVCVGAELDELQSQNIEQVIMSTLTIMYPGRFRYYKIPDVTHSFTSGNSKAMEEIYSSVSSIWSDQAA